MTILRGTLVPKIGSNQELLDLLKEWVDWRGGEGDHVAVSRTVWSETGLKYHAVSSHESIGDADAFRQEMNSNDRYKSMISRMFELISKPTRWQLLEVVVPVNNPGIKAVSLRAALAPKIGHIPEVRSLLSDWTKHVQSLGVQSSLLQQVWGDAPVFMQRLAYDSLGEAASSRNSKCGS